MIDRTEGYQPRSARAGSSPLDELSSVLLDVSLDGDVVVVALDEVSLGDEVVALELLSIVEDVAGEVDDESVLLMLPLLLVPSFVGRAEVEGVFWGVGATYGLDAALGELLLGTESLVVWAMVTPAALTMATTAAMLRVLDRSFMCRTPFSVS